MEEDAGQIELDLEADVDVGSVDRYPEVNTVAVSLIGKGANYWATTTT